MMKASQMRGFLLFMKLTFIWDSGIIKMISYYFVAILGLYIYHL